MRRAIFPDARPDLDNLRRAQRSMSAVHLLARVGGRPVRTGVSSAFPGMTEAPFLRADASVIPEYRRRGIGERLLRRVSARGCELGQEVLQLEVREDDEASIRFVEKRGYREVEREKAVMLDLARLGAPPAIEPPPGVAIVSRAERPDLERQLYEVDRERPRMSAAGASQRRSNGRRSQLRTRAASPVSSPRASTTTCRCGA